MQRRAASTCAHACFQFCPSLQPALPPQLSRRKLRVVAAVRGAVKAPSPVKVNLQVGYRVQFGQSLGVVGAGELLGHWDGSKAVPMKWTDGDLWVTELTIQPGAAMQLEYKYVVVNSDGKVSHWKPGQNCKLDVLAEKGTRITVAETWEDGPRHVEVGLEKEEREEAEPEAMSSTPAESATAIIQQQVDNAIEDLEEALDRQVQTMQHVSDPTDIKLIYGDRLLAAANNKAVALNKAFKASDALPQLPKWLSERPQLARPRKASR
ncbi:carbohydrate-binding-like protein [Haematococcus lacustris]